MEIKKLGPALCQPLFEDLQPGDTFLSLGGKTYLKVFPSGGLKANDKSLNAVNLEANTLVVFRENSAVVPCDATLYLKGRG